MTHAQLNRFEAALKQHRDVHVRLEAEAAEAGKLEHKFIHEDQRKTFDACLYLLHLYSDGQYGEA